jgi:hypothetical protein
MITELVGAWADLLASGKVFKILDNGEQGVYRQLGELVSDAVSASVPAYAVAMSACNAGSQIYNASQGKSGMSCTEYSERLLTNVISEACHAVGLDYVIRALVQVWEAIPDAIKALLDLDNYLKVAEQVAEFLTDVVGNTIKAIGDAAAYLRDLGAGIWDEISSLWDGVTNLGTWIVDTVEHYIDYAWKLASDVIDAIVQIPEQVAQVLRNAANAIAEATGTVVEWIEDAADTVVGAVEDVYNAGKDVISSAYDEVSSWF